MSVIQIEHLDKWYGKHRGILGLDLYIEQGEFFGLIGPNGAGKSTLIRCLLGSIDPTAGSIQIFGKPLKKRQVSHLRRIGYLPSEAIFYPGMRVKEALAFSARLKRLDNAQERKELCLLFDLDPQKKIDELSFGQRKKVAIICALQGDPDLLILDEPTSGLDPLMQQVFFERVCALHERGTTIIMASHILSEIQTYCTRAAVLKEGRLIACEQIEALMQKQLRRVIVHPFLEGFDMSDLQIITQTSDGFEFLYTGPMDALIDRLHSHHLRDLTICRPEVEDLFFHYYQKEKDV